MKLYDLFEEDFQDSPRLDADDSSGASKSDTRKTRLSLMQISKLRKLQDLKKIEYHTSMQNIQKQYGGEEESKDTGF